MTVTRLVTALSSLWRRSSRSSSPRAATETSPEIGCSGRGRGLCSVVAKLVIPPPVERLVQLSLAIVFLAPKPSCYLHLTDLKSFTAISGPTWRGAGPASLAAPQNPKASFISTTVMRPPGRDLPVEIASRSCPVRLLIWDAVATSQ
jgi:hypothetical protein